MGASGAPASRQRAGYGPRQAGELAAVYHETEQAGLAQLAEPDAALALLPLAFWLQHRTTLGLVPQLQAVQQGGEAAEDWSLAVATGAGSRPPAVLSCLRKASGGE